MRTISRTTRFKKDYKRESKGQHRSTLDTDLIAILRLLVDDKPLPERSTITRFQALLDPKLTQVRNATSWKRKPFGE